MGFLAMPAKASGNMATVLPDDHTRPVPPEGHISLEDRRDRVVSLASLMSVTSTIPECLGNRVSLLTERVAYFEAYWDRLIKVRNVKSIGNTKFQEAMNLGAEVLEKDIRELRMLNRGRHTFEEDLLEMEEETKGKRTHMSLWEEIKYLSNSSSGSMVSRVISYSRHKNRKWDESHFQNRVMNRLNAHNPERECIGWCHLTGWDMKSDITVARLVPKMLENVGLPELFGPEVDTVHDLRNGIVLHKSIAKHLESGDIVFVPIATPPGTRTRWICHVADPSKREDSICRWYPDGGFLKCGELDQEEITFLSHNQPLRRYFYFRFIFSYIYAKRDGNVEWTDKIEGREVVWTLPGKYMRRSMICALARNISGADLPSFLADDNTFESESSTEYSETALCANFRVANLTFIKNKERLKKGRSKAGELSDTSDDEEINSDDDESDEKDY